MSKLIVSGQKIIGTFASIDTMADGYLADGAIYPFSVIGESEIVNSDLPSDFSLEKYMWDSGSIVIDPKYIAPHPSVNDYVIEVQTHLDTTAQTHHYDNIMSACTYATSTVPKFAAEGQACVAWRDQVWSACYHILDEVQSGARSAPGIAELLAELPEMVWPV